MTIGVIIGDLVRSRDVNDRPGLQKRLQGALKEANQRFGASAVAPLEIVRGDEFEGGYYDPSVCFNVFSFLERKIYPARIKAGLGVGTLSTPVKDSISLMDGSAFHRARSAIELAKNIETDIVLKSPSEDRDDMLNAVFELISLIKEDWTGRQWEIVNYYRADTSMTQSDIAKNFGVSQPAIAKILNRAKINHLTKTYEVIKSQLKKLGDEK